jgi:tetrapyrrole methylase family protein / MazG family protein
MVGGRGPRGPAHARVTPRVVVVGLGPAGADLVLPAARQRLEEIPTRRVRTARHPAVDDLAAEGITFRSFDDVYERADDLDAVYERIASAVVDAAGDGGEVVYAVPGSPAVAERTVLLLRDRADAGEITLEVVPGLSFAELAWSRLGVDPVGGARVVDGRDLTSAAVGGGGPLLIAQVDSAALMSEVKLTLLESLDPATPTTILSRLGLPDERVESVALADLDRGASPDHLTAVFVDVPDAAETGGAVTELTRLLDLALVLRGPGGCPWDAEQTHHSLTRYLLEEAYEVVEAVEALPAGAPGTAVDPVAYAALADELGDLLYQVVFHAVLAEEAGAFDMGDVARGIHDKLVHRHPHVFGDVDAQTSAAVMRNWEQIKKEEQGRSSLVEGVSPGLPSLLYAHKLYRKAASVGLEPGDAVTAAARLRHAATAIEATGPDDVEAALGEVLAATVAIARAHGVDAESALRGWSARFRERFVAMEQLAQRRGVDLGAASPDEVSALWREARGRETGGQGGS